MGLDATKPVFRASDKARLKPVSSAMETSLKIEISRVASLDTILNKNADQSAGMHRMVCALFVRKNRRRVFLRRGPTNASTQASR